MMFTEIFPCRYFDCPVFYTVRCRFFAALAHLQLGKKYGVLCKLILFSIHVNNAVSCECCIRLNFVTLIDLYFKWPEKLDLVINLPIESDDN